MKSESDIFAEGEVRKSLIQMVGRPGFEPGTNGLKVRYKRHFCPLTGIDFK